MLVFTFASRALSAALVSDASSDRAPSKPASILGGDVATAEAVAPLSLGTRSVRPQAGQSTCVPAREFEMPSS